MGAESIAGEGSVFWVELPLAAAPDERAGATVANARPRRAGERRKLLYGESCYILKTTFPISSSSSACSPGGRPQEWGGRLDAVVNNAGTGWQGATHTMPIDAWRRMDVNLTEGFVRRTR